MMVVSALALAAAFLAVHWGAVYSLTYLHERRENARILARHSKR